MSKRIEFLKEKLKKYQKELEEIIEEEKLLNEINSLKKKIVNVKISNTANKKITYIDLKKEEVLKELEKTNYKMFKSECGRIYYVTTDGEFYSDTKHLRKHHINGYEYVTIDGKSKLVHRVVWEVFNGKIPEKMEIDHKDTDRLNNRLDNLRVVTPSENKRNPITLEHYKESNKNKGIVRYRNEKKMLQDLEV